MTFLPGRKMTEKIDLEDLAKDFIIEGLDEVRHPLEIAIYGTENYFNAGCIVRTAHNFLASKIHLINTEFYPKATMSARRWEKKNILKWSLNDFIKEYRDKNVIGFERRDTLDTKDIYSFDYPDNPIIVFGSEKLGLPDEIIEICKDIISIPIYGLLNDFNISVAAGIGMYDWLKKHYQT